MGAAPRRGERRRVVFRLPPRARSGALERCGRLAQANSWLLGRGATRWRLCPTVDSRPTFLTPIAQRYGTAALVQILFNGSPGPQEVVCRHPSNWGWVLYSQGTCGTSFEMPARQQSFEEEDEEIARLRRENPDARRSFRCSDPLLRDEALKELPSQVERDF